MQAVRMAAERAVDRAVPFAQDGGAVDVDRRPYRFSDRGQRNTVALECLGGAGETDHGDV
jgi:hypothetical protein